MSPVTVPARTGYARNESLGDRVDHKHYARPETIMGRDEPTPIHFHAMSSFQATAKQPPSATNIAEMGMGREA